MKVWLPALKLSRGSDPIYTLPTGHRVHPTTAQAPRVCLEDIILPTGGGADGRAPIFVRKGDHLMASMWALHQDEDLWGPDATMFRPVRYGRLSHSWADHARALRSRWC